MIRRRFLQVTGAAGALAGVSNTGAATADTDGSTDSSSGSPDEVLIGVDRNVVDIEATVSEHLPSSAKVVDTNDVLNYARARVGNVSTTDRQAMIDSVQGKSSIRYAEYNGTLQALYTPNDPEFGNQYAPQMVNAPDAWDVTEADSGVKIAVVDQGVKYDHPDLVDNVDTSVTNHGYDFVANDGDPYPEDLSDSGEYHGTHVAGIAAAATDNGEGVAGISNAAILCVRALDATGSGSYSDIADGIQYAADQNADVINLSLGGGESSTVRDALAYAYSHGSLIVAAAGNDYRNHVSYPAAHDECLAVSALDSSGGLASYSNVGKEIEIAAPGSAVLSTWTDDGYDSISGTSMATPVVAGVAALAKAQHGLDNEELRTHLKRTAVDIGLSAGEQGAGRVDALAAVTDQVRRTDHLHLGETWTGTADPGLKAEIQQGRALIGETTASHDQFDIGVVGRSNATSGRGIAGYADATSGTAFGVLGRSASTEGGGVFGFTGPDTGNVKGVLGVTASPDGTGTLGFNNATSGVAEGMRGETKSTDGTGVVGKATASSGATIGVRGEAASSDGFGLYTPDDAKVDGTEVVGGGVVHTQRGDPTTSELDPGQVMTYVSDGSGTGSAGDLVYAVNDGGTIKTSIAVQRSDAT